jgi:hypothetical protein
MEDGGRAESGMLLSPTMYLLPTQWSRGIFEAFCLIDIALVYFTNPIFIALYKLPGLIDLNKFGAKSSY